jgi:hypothetical protein
MGGGSNHRGDPSVTLGFVTGGTAITAVGATSGIPLYFKVPVLLPSSLTPSCGFPQTPTYFPGPYNPGCNPYGAGPGYLPYQLPQVPNFNLSGGNLLFLATPTNSVFVANTVVSLASLGIGLEIDPGNLFYLVFTATNAATLESLGLITGTTPTFSVAAGYTIQVTAFAN